MEVSSPLYAYKETRLDLDSSTQDSTIAIRLPSNSISTALSRATHKRSNTTDFPLAEDENVFRQKHLATAASIYYRQHHKSPRSFLWRILEGGKVLSIRALDVSKQSNAAEAYLTLHLTFPHEIWNSCIAFSDSKDHDVLSVFVVTEQKTVWTLTLRPDFFRKPSSTEDNVADWCKSYIIHTLGMKKPHRLVALNADELLVSTIDGSIVRLNRKSGGDGLLWKDQQYNEGWKGIRSAFRGGNTISYGDKNLNLSTATAIASPMTILDGTPYVFTICLDHRLRVWNMATSKIAYMGDIITQGTEQQEEAKKVIDPSHSQLIKVIKVGDDSALCITYSPLGPGVFKFWNVRPTIDGNLEFKDIFPKCSLIPMAPTSDIWTLADFSVVLDQNEPGVMTLWALWKNNVTYRVHSVEFQSGSAHEVDRAWSSGWKAMASETLRDADLPSTMSSESSDVTDKWLEYILSPGRFTVPTLETGLAIYERGLGLRKDTSRRTGSLADRMCTSIGSTFNLGRKSDGSMNYDVFRSEIDTQWRRFSRLLDELDKNRGEAMSLVVDPEGKMPYVILADGITAIRDCSRLEQIWHNQGRVDRSYEQIATPLFAASSFRETLPDNFIYKCKSVLEQELFQELSLTPVARMRAFYDACDFANQVGEEEYGQLVAGLGKTFTNLTGEVYEDMLELMKPSGDFDKRPQKLPLAEFGNKLIVRGVQEIVELHRNVCLDQLILLIFVEGEINHGEDGIEFDTSTVLTELMDMLTRIELMHWLSSTQMSFTIKKMERSSSVVEKNSLTKKQGPTIETVTILEGLLRHLFALDLRADESMSAIVTHVLLQICTPRSEYVVDPAVVQCFLLKNDRADLAMEFSRFLGNEPFSIYVQGRACLAANDPMAASMLFKKAAFGMAYPNSRKRVENHSAGYLDETEKSLLNAGLPEYYSHIVALFDKEKNYSLVVDFARLSLQFIRPTGEVQSLYLRTDMQSRLFNAALQTARYDIAHSVLSLFSDSALQTSSLRTLITKMCETSHATEFMNLPFVGLQDAVDAILAQKCQSIINVTVGVPYHNILYAWRIKRSDFRGAAAISLDRLQKLQQSGDGDKMIGDDGLETPVTKQYICLINALSCVDPKQAWILSEELPSKTTGAFKLGEKVQLKRKVVKLEDVKRSYQEELDRIAAIQNNQFAFAGGDEMGVL